MVVLDLVVGFGVGRGAELRGDAVGVAQHRREALGVRADDHHAGVEAAVDRRADLRVLAVFARRPAGARLGEKVSFGDCAISSMFCAITTSVSRSTTLCHSVWFHAASLAYGAYHLATDVAFGDSQQIIALIVPECYKTPTGTGIEISFTRAPSALKVAATGPSIVPR